MSEAIQVSDLCKFYGSVRAVDRISFNIAPGELVGFLGNNGAGKSTTMRVLTTFMPASSGTAAVAGFDVMYQSDEVRRRLGYLPESVPLYPEMRVEEYLVYRAKLKGVERAARTSRHHLPDVEKICDRVIIINRGVIKHDGKLSEMRAKVPLVLLEAKGSADSLERVLRKLPHVVSVTPTAAEPADAGYAAVEVKGEPG